MICSRAGTATIRSTVAAATTGWRGAAADDQLAGGSGDDYLDGGPGTDLLGGGTGHDVLVLADIRDAATELPLGADSGGNDTVVVTDGYGSSLASALPATGGKATFVLGRPDLASFPHDVAAFHQQIDPDIENIRLEGSGAHDVVGDDRDSIIIGNAGANHLYGGGGADHIDGGAGGDWIHGGGGDDWILGGDGNDWIDGGDGADTLYGGAGDDTFVLGLHEGQDRVFDHEGHNALILKGGADPGGLTAELQGNDLVLTHADQVIATVQDYAHHADSFTGIDLGQGLRPLDDFIVHQPEPALAHADSADWLADYLPAPSRRHGNGAGRAVEHDGGPAIGRTGTGRFRAGGRRRDRPRDRRRHGRHACRFREPADAQRSDGRWRSLAAGRPGAWTGIRRRRVRLGA